MFMRGRTLYVAIGTGDAGRPGPFPGTTIPNPDGVSSPIFSSILAVHFSVPVERNTTGFTLTAEDQQALADGDTVGMSGNAGGLIVWPARLMVPVGFLLLTLQGISELIKRIAFLRGLIPDPSEKHEGPTLEEQLAEALRKERGEAA